MRRYFSKKMRNIRVILLCIENKFSSYNLKKSSILYNVVLELWRLLHSKYLDLRIIVRELFSDPYILMGLLIYFFFVFIPIIILTGGLGLFIRVLNYWIFIFYFTISGFYLLLDTIFFFLLFIILYVYYFIKERYYRLCLFVLNRFGFFSYYVFNSSIFFIFLILSIFLGYVLVFQFSPLYAGYFVNDIPTFLDELVGYSNTIGTRYLSSYWWYFRIYIFYLIVYIIVPRSRIYIRENLDFIIWFPGFLFVYDYGLLSTELSLPSYGFGHHEAYPRVSSSLDPRHNFETFLATFPFWRGRFFEPLYDNSDEYYSQLMSQSIREDSPPKTRFPYEGPYTTRMFDGSSESQNIRGNYDWDALYRYAHFGTEHSYLARRAHNLVYVLNPGEADYLVNDFNDVIPIREMYADENYYNRMMEDIDKGTFFNRVMPYEDYIDMIENRKQAVRDIDVIDRYTSRARYFYGRK